MCTIMHHHCPYLKFHSSFAPWPAIFKLGHLRPFRNKVRWMVKPKINNQFHSTNIPTAASASLTKMDFKIFLDCQPKAHAESHIENKNRPL